MMRTPRLQADEKTDELVTITRRTDRWRLLRLVLAVQGFFYALTGLWPFLHLSSFVRVVGEKRDIFQLDVTSALIVVIGAVLLLAALRRRPDASAVALGVGSALAFVLMELRFRHTVRGVFWLDFAVELIFALVLAAIYLAASWQERRRR